MLSLWTSKKRHDLVTTEGLLEKQHLLCLYDITSA